jgi:methionyl aminopeptidase
LRNINIHFLCLAAVVESEGVPEGEETKGSTGPGVVKGNKPSAPVPNKIAPGTKPTIPISDQFKSKKYPEGEIQEYKIHGSVSPEELRARDSLQEETYNEIRQAAEAHRQTRQYMRNFIKPGMTMIQICEELESTARHLIKEDGLKAGLAFPTGCSLNNVAAHYTPNNGDSMTIGYDDVCKIDFGVHVNGKCWSWKNLLMHGKSA